MKTILVTGASGVVGSAIVRHLVEAEATVKAGTRNPAAYDGPAGVIPVSFDYEDTSTWENAIQGVEAILLVAPPLDAHSDEKLIPFIEAALAHGVPQFVFISALGIEYAPESALGKIEAYLQQNAPIYTILRPTFFMENFSEGFLSPQIKIAKGLYLNAEEGATVFVSTEDIAAMATKVLLHDGHHGKAYGLTGPEALTHQQVIDYINGVSGGSYAYTKISNEAIHANFVKNGGLNDSQAEQAVTMYTWVAQNTFIHPSPHIEEVLGRPATSFAHFAKKNADVWE
jgi:uncharacterized protein YbjT (DUF2867 family)